MDTLAVELLSTPELEVGEALLETLTYLYVLQFFLNQIAGILDQVKGDFKISRLNKLVQYRH